MSSEVSGPYGSADGARAGRDLIVQAGHDERKTIELIESRARAQFNDAAKGYFDALQRYAGSAYKVLKFPEGVTLEQVYVPLRGRTRGTSSESLYLADAIGSAFKANSRQVLIEGAPGSGKSTLLRQIARHAWERPHLVGLDQPYIPLPVRLRSYSEAEGVSREARIWTAIDRAREFEIVGARPPNGFFEVWPKELQAPWLLLLDGFDEVQIDKRQETLEWLTQLQADGISYLVTTRPTEEIRDLPDNLAHFDVQPFTREQQLELATKWLPHSAVQFMAEFDRFAAGELGGTPLLLTIAAVVFLKQGALPVRRSELYRRFVHDTWQEGLKRGAIEDLDAEIRDDAAFVFQRALGVLARRMTEDPGEGPVLDFASDSTRLMQALASLLKLEFEFPDRLAVRRAEKLFRVLGTRSGVFIADTYHCEWLHPTFREFLTAEVLTQSNDSSGVDSVVLNCTYLSWNQVALFLVGLQSENENVAPILRRIAQADPPNSLTVAAEAVSEGANVDEQFVGELVEQLCGAIRSLAKGNYCGRLLTAGAHIFGL